MSAEPCPSCERDLSYPGQPGHVCYTYAQRAVLIANSLGSPDDEPRVAKMGVPELQAEAARLRDHLYRARSDALHWMWKWQETDAELVRERENSSLASDLEVGIGRLSAEVDELRNTTTGGKDLNCPVCGSGEFGDCICPLAEEFARAEWNASGRAVYESRWEDVSPMKRHSLTQKAMPDAHAFVQGHTEDQCRPELCGGASTDPCGKATRCICNEPPVSRLVICPVHPDVHKQAHRKDCPCVLCHADRLGAERSVVAEASECASCGCVDVFIWSPERKAWLCGDCITRVEAGREESK